MPDCCESMEIRVKDLEKDAERNREAHKEFYARIREAEQELKLQKQMLTELVGIRNDLQELKSIPAKRWNAAVSSALQWLIVAALTASQLFLK